ncbi:MAG: iron chaperone [Thermoanaerobaculia bacterium]
MKRYALAGPKAHRARFAELQALIRRLYPKTEAVISYGIPTDRARAGWVGLGYWKDGVSLYTNGPQHIADFKAAYPKIKTGKGSINFRVTDEVPFAGVKRVIRHAMEDRKS